MSNGRPHRRRRPDPLAAVLGPLAAVLGPLDGARIPGGCDHCDAYQVAAPIAAGVWHLAVFHDEWCPVHGDHASADSEEPPA